LNRRGPKTPTTSTRERGSVPKPTCGAFGSYQSSEGDLEDPLGDPSRRREKLDALWRLNELLRRDRAIDSPHDDRIASFERAFRMQRQTPEVFAIDAEGPATRKLYGIEDPATESFGRQPAGAPAGRARHPVRTGLRRHDGQ
jgi:hypothetical protein